MKWIAGLCSGGAQLALALLLALVSVEIVARSAFGVSTLIADEYGAYLFVALTYLGFVPTFLRGQFLRMELVVDRLPPSVARMLLRVGLAIGFGLLVVLAYEAGVTGYTSYSYGLRSSHASGTPVFIPQLFMFLGLALLALAFLVLTLKEIRSR